MVAAWSGRDARIKWPNDVRVDGRKIAGILVERGPGAVIGIGLNVNIRLDEFPDELRDSATSLRILTGGRVDRSELARALIERLDAWYDAGRTHGPQALNPRWRERSEHWGQTVEVSTPSGTVRGRLDDLDLLHGLTLSGRRPVPPACSRSRGPRDHHPRGGRPGMTPSGRFGRGSTDYPVEWTPVG